MQKLRLFLSKVPMQVPIVLLCWFSVKWKAAFSLSEYNAIFGWPVCTA